MAAVKNNRAVRYSASHAVAHNPIVAAASAAGNNIPAPIGTSFNTSSRGRIVGRAAEQRNPSYGNAIWPVFRKYITEVSVSTDTKVPSRTATEAGSTQLSYCRAITNTFSAGGNDASSTAVAAQSGGNGPS